MLVTCNAITNPGRQDPTFALVTAANGNSADAKILDTGVYEIGHFGGSHFPGWGWSQYTEGLVNREGDYFGCYGVCDGWANLRERCPMLMTSARKFCVTLTPVRRNQANANRGGGWRWHKWGDYIGKHTPTTEYLDDEPLIELVYVYHIYEQE